MWKTIFHCLTPNETICLYIAIPFIMRHFSGTSHGKLPRRAYHLYAWTESLLTLPWLFHSNNSCSNCSGRKTVGFCRSFPIRGCIIPSILLIMIPILPHGRASYWALWVYLQSSRTPEDNLFRSLFWARCLPMIFSDVHI